MESSNLYRVNKEEDLETDSSFNSVFCRRSAVSGIDSR